MTEESRGSTVEFPGGMIGRQAGAPEDTPAASGNDAQAAETPETGQDAESAAAEPVTLTDRLLGPAAANSPAEGQAVPEGQAMPEGQAVPEDTPPDAGAARSGAAGEPGDQLVASGPKTAPLGPSTNPDAKAIPAQQPGPEAGWLEPPSAPLPGEYDRGVASGGYPSGQGIPRPGFAPYEQDPRAAAGTGYGWPPQTHNQPGPPNPFGPGGPGGPGGMAPPPPPAPHAHPVPPGPPGFGGPPNWAPVPTPPMPQRPAPGLSTFVLIALVVALVAGAVGAGVGVIAGGRSDNGRVVDLGAGKSAGTSGSGAKNRPADSVAGVAQKVLPSVVKIQVSLGNGEGGTGTGFLVKDGYIMTNNHVVAEAAQGAQMQIVFNDKRSTGGTIVGRDPTSDVAVVKPDNTFGLPGLQLGNSDDLAVGDPVIAIGSPLGLQGSVTTGIVSALNRPVGTSGAGGTGDGSVLNAIQTDAAINPGNSGGPLLDATGRVIGMNTAIATLGGGGGGLGGQQESGSIGLGFAIPINQASRVAEEIINHGGKAPQHAIIGISLDQTYQGNGVRVATSAAGGTAPVTPGGPADKIGIKAGDIITAFDGKPVSAPNELVALIRSHQPGDTVKITYTRAGKSTTADITLGGGS